MAALPAATDEASTEIVSDSDRATRIPLLPSIIITTANGQTYTLSWKCAPTLKPVMNPKPKSKQEASSVADAIAMKLAELYMHLQQVKGEFVTERDKLREEITLLQEHLDALTR